MHDWYCRQPKRFRVTQNVGVTADWRETSAASVAVVAELAAAVASLQDVGAGRRVSSGKEQQTIRVMVGLGNREAC